MRPANRNVRGGHADRSPNRARCHSKQPPPPSPSRLRSRLLRRLRQPMGEAGRSGTNVPDILPLIMQVHPANEAVPVVTLWRIVPALAFLGPAAL